MNDPQQIREHFQKTLQAVIDAGACPMQPTTVIDLESGDADRRAHAAAANCRGWASVRSDAAGQEAGVPRLNASSTRCASNPVCGWPRTSSTGVPRGAHGVEARGAGGIGFDEAFA